MSTFRGFIALEITPSSVMTEFEKEIEKSGADVKLVEPHNIHITLKFLGDTQERYIWDIEGIIRDAVRGLKPFSIKLKGTGVFPNENYVKVVWIGIEEGNIIGTLAQTIDNGVAGLGFKKENRGFSPHLTIGRVRTAKNKQQMMKVIEKYRMVEFSVQEVASIHLKKSELTPKGPLYTSIREIKL
jgi:2'-5' RNA ligase